MAQKVQVVLLDDIDQTPADETVTFAVDGVTYKIDLTAEHAEELREDFGAWIQHARRSGGRKSSGRPVAKRADLSAMRAWARKNGHKVSDRGRISAEVQAAYDKAHRR